MIKLMSEPIEDMFFNLVEESSKSIKLCAPYVKNDIVETIFSTKKSDVQLEIISNFSLPNFYKGSSDLEAFKQSLNHKSKVYNCQTLHAKIYIFDERYTIITSANLTTSGFRRNVEYDVFIDQKDLVEKSVTDYIKICEQPQTGKINDKHILQIQHLLNSLQPKENQSMDEMDLYTEVDNVLDGDTEGIKNSLSEWKKLIFNVLNSIGNETFTLKDVYGLENLFKEAYPNNKTIRASIRRNLQELRDLGLIKFVGNGEYKKLWR